MKNCSMTMFTNMLDSACIFDGDSVPVSMAL